MAYQGNTVSKIFSTKLTANDSTAKETLGTVRELADGRKFRYVKMTGADGALGRVYVRGAVVSITTNLTSANGKGPDGATTTIITASDESYTPDAYIGYYFKVTTAMTGSEEPIKIVGNTATTLTLERQLGTACNSAGTDDATLQAPRSVVQKCSADDLTAVLCGVGIGTITQNYYGWVQTRGYAAVISTAALVDGEVCSSGGATTAGQAVVRAGATENILGITIRAGGTNDYQLVDLLVD